MSRRTRAAGVLDDSDREGIRGLIARVGEREAAAVLDVSRHTLGRLLSGLPIQKGTAALVLQRLGAVEQPSCAR